MNRLSKRLERIEQQTIAEPSGEANEMLVDLLARRDAIFWPWRTRASFRGEVRQLEEDYLCGKRGVSAKADGKEAWKSAHYTRNELLERGWVTAARSGGQVTTLFLAPQGEADARALVGMPGIDPEVLQLLNAADGIEFGGRWWTCESTLWQHPLTDNPTDWDFLTELVLPLLTCGAVLANCDAWNRVWYAIDDAVTLPEKASSTLTEQPGLHSRYIDAFDGERTSLTRLENTGSRLVIPIPCGLGPKPRQPIEAENGN